MVFVVSCGSACHAWQMQQNLLKYWISPSVQVLLLHNATFEARTVHKHWWFLIGRVPHFRGWFFFQSGAFFRGFFFFPIQRCFNVKRSSSHNGGSPDLVKSKKLTTKLGTDWLVERSRDQCWLADSGEYGRFVFFSVNVWRRTKNGGLSGLILKRTFPELQNTYLNTRKTSILQNKEGNEARILVPEQSRSQFSAVA